MNLEKMRQKRPLLLLLAILALIAAIWSFIWLTTPKTPTLDQQVHDVADQLKCPVCQGESVADSPSAISKQMREVIREQLQAGKSEPEVVQYFVNRYGDQILWSPPWQGITLLAWLAPLVLLFGGSALLFLVLRDWRSIAISVQVTEEDKAVARELAGIDAKRLDLYRSQLEKELAADDPLF